MPSDLALKAMNGVHRAIVKLSGGRAGYDVNRMPVLELVTTGRKSGQRRAVMLTSPYQEGEMIVVVASRGGDDTHPAWFHNLVANPSVEVSWKGAATRPMHAHVATPDERARLWPLVIKDHKNYAGYQRKTEREIPLVLLTPAS
jgi:deazaflavin-dependent oxidoreductase (nitroreductase family)